MPWTVSGVVEKREDFLADFVSGDWTMSELCRMHGISRPTGYAVLRRYTADGDQGLAERSHAPQRHPNQTPAEIEQLVLELRRAQPLWGPRPLKKILEDGKPQLAIPAARINRTIPEREGPPLPVSARGPAAVEEDRGKRQSATCDSGGKHHRGHRGA